MMTKSSFKCIPYLLLAVLLYFRAASIMVGIGWLPEKGLPNGDAYDYVYKARYLYETGSLQTERQYLIVMKNHGGWGNFRPPGYSVLLAPLMIFGKKDIEITKTVRLFSILLDTLILIVITFIVFRFNPSVLFRIVSTLVITLQPWTAGYVHWIIPDGVVAFLSVTSIIFFSTFLLSASDRKRSIFLFSGSTLISLSFLFRPEMIIFAPLLSVLCIFLVERNLKKVIRYGVIAAIPFLIITALNVGYRYHIDGKIAIFGRGKNPTPGLSLWATTFIANEHTKNAVRWYWPKGKKLSIDLPDSAFDNIDERKKVNQIIEELQNGELFSSEHDHIFRNIAEQRRKRSSLRCDIWVPLYNGYINWWNSGTMPGYNVFLRKYLHVPHRMKSVTVYFLKYVVFTSFFLSLFLINWVELKKTMCWATSITLISIYIVLIRTSLIMLITSHPENRYMLPTWPLILIVTCYVVSTLHDSIKKQRSKIIKCFTS